MAVCLCMFMPIRFSDGLRSGLGLGIYSVASVISWHPMHSKVSRHRGLLHDWMSGPGVVDFIY